MKAGRASHIEDLGDGRILRRGGNPVREAVVMEHARRHGYPVPEVHEVRGDALVLEKVDGPTLQEDIQVRPWMLARHMRTLAALHDRLHEIEHPEGGTLLHLDLHTENVVLGPDGPMVIDWTNARSGVSALDPALVWVIFRTSGVPIVSRLAARLFISHFDPVEIAGALDDAYAYRLADPNLYPAEKARILRLRGR